MDKIIDKIGTLIGTKTTEETAKVLGLKISTAYNLNSGRVNKNLKLAYEQIYTLLLQLPEEAKQTFFNPLKPSRDSFDAQTDMKKYLLRQIKKNEELREKCLKTFVDYSVKMIQLDLQNKMLQAELNTLTKVKSPL